MYSISPKDSLFNAEKKSKFIVINIPKSKAHAPIVELKDNRKFTNSDGYFIVFKVEKDICKTVQDYLEVKLNEFIKEHGSIKEKSPNDFLKFLEADSTYHFEDLSSNEKLNEPSDPIKLTEINKEEAALSQNFLDAEQGPSPRSQSSSLIEEKIETENLRRVDSLSKLAVENSDRTESIESLTASQDSIRSESQKLTNNQNDQLAREIQSVFSNENKILLNINKHGSAIQKGYFNGVEKSTHLSLISAIAEKINLDSCDLLNNSSSVVNVNTLKQNIYELKTYINDKGTTDALSRYRGFSPLRCIAAFFGGGRVKSIEFVEQLQEQLDTLTNNISQIRPTA